jgi:SAM-dependent methyltransferase
MGALLLLVVVGVAVAMALAAPFGGSCLGFDVAYRNTLPAVRKQLDLLYPSAERMARERVGREAQGFFEGKFVENSSTRGELTYGEFDLEFHDHLVQRALVAGRSPEQASELQQLNFLDIGSGVGRLCIAQALRRDCWHNIVGVEIVPQLHDMGLKALAQIKEEQRHDANLSNIELLLGDVHEADFISQVAPDVAFCYCSTWPSRGVFVTELSYTLGTRMKPGARVITVDKQLASEKGLWEFELLEECHGANAETGGEGSIGYIWERKRF